MKEMDKASIIAKKQVDSVFNELYILKALNHP